jgi:hypothetical protein
MRKLFYLATVSALLTASARAERLGYHEIQTDAAGQIVPWSSAEPAQGYDHVIGLVWNFWKNMGTCSNGIPYFFQHQVWKPEHDPRGLWGDQFGMALSSLNLLYSYSAVPSTREMMVRIADYCLHHGFSSNTGAWPNLPYPYNTDRHSGRIDGDMRAGKGFLQPDKAGSFGIELLTLTWATYMVDFDGKNRYPNDDIWLTDGYGDCLRHYLRAMAAMPELAPSGHNHLLRCSSVIQQIDFQASAIRYQTFDAASRDRLRVAFEGVDVTADGVSLKKLSRAENLDHEDGYFLETMGTEKGLLEIRHSQSKAVVVQRKGNR